MRLSRILLATVVSASLALPVYAQDAGAQQTTTPKHSKRTQGPKTANTAPGAANALSRADQVFIEKAITGGLAEVGMGKLAVDKASNPQVKQFGQRMVDDHTKAGQDMNQLADAKGLNPPSELTAKDQAEKDKLSKLSGADFDKAYMEHMVKDHQKDVSMFKKTAEKGDDPDVKAAAQKTLPTLEDHLKQAQQIESQVKGSSKSSSKKDNDSVKPSAFIDKK